MSSSVHTIPVPRGWSPEQAWEAIVRGDTLTDPEPFWANVLIVDGRFAELLAIESDEGYDAAGPSAHAT